MTDHDAKSWIERLKKEEAAHKAWRDKAEEAEHAYFDDRKDGKKQLYNVFYSTVQTLHARLYSKSPVPDVRRRFDGGQGAQLAKLAAQATERALGYTLDTSDFDAAANRIVDDYLISGLGVPWVEYDAKVDQDEMGQPVIALQAVNMRHVPWRRFHWEPGKDWGDVDWVARDHYLTASELKQQFDREPESELQVQEDGKKRDEEKYAPCYRVSEVWYRPARTVYVIGWNFDSPLEVRKDALNLQGFFPCPRPGFANLPSRELVPTPDYAFFAANYEYLNRITRRIHSLTSQIKSVGFYDAQLSEIAQLATADDGTMVPVRDLAERLNTAGGAAVFDRVVASLPIREKAEVLNQLQQSLAIEKARLDEQTGIADVVQGSSDPNETATAQRIKSNWASLRLARKQGEVSRLLRDVFRIFSEIMSEHYTPESWYLQSGLQMPPEVLQIIKTDVGRTLAIDVETDSTVALDDEAEKQAKIEMLNYFAPFVQQVVPLVNAGQLPADLANAMLKFAVGSFKHGRALEEVIDALPTSQQQLQQMTQQVQQGQQQMQQMQEQMQVMQQQLQQVDMAKQQSDGMKSQADVMKVQADQQKAVIGVQQAQRKDQIDAFKAQTDRIAVMRENTTNVNVM